MTDKTPPISPPTPTPPPTGPGLEEFRKSHINEVVTYYPAPPPPAAPPAPRGVPEQRK